MQVDYHVIGEHIQTLRLERGLTQAQLAELSGYSTHYIGNIEQGARKPSLSALLAISHALETTPDSILADCFQRHTQVRRYTPEDDHTLREESVFTLTLTDLFDNRLLPGDLFGEPVPDPEAPPKRPFRKFGDDPVLDYAPYPCFQRSRKKKK